MNIKRFESSESGLIVRSPDRLGIAFTPKAQETLGQALALAGHVDKVLTPEDQKRAVAAQIALKEIISATEKARAEAKAPALAYGRAVDAAAKDFIAQADAEILLLVDSTELLGDRRGHFLGDHVHARGQRVARPECPSHEFHRVGELSGELLQSTGALVVQPDPR